MQTKITTIILTFNEELHIARAIKNAQQISSRVIVVDSFSTDKTVSIAHTLNAEVFSNPFINQAQQFQWAVDHCVINSEWIFRLDADEYLEDDLIEEIRGLMITLPDDINGLCFKRKHYFLGKWIKHGDRYPLIMLRLFRRGTAHIEQKWMDEHIVLDEGRSIICQHDFVDDNLNSVSWFIDKHNRYASREMFDIMTKKYSTAAQEIDLPARTSMQASVKRYIKNHIYDRLPIFVRPTLYFIYRYCIRLGFLDGKAGFAYHFMQGFWYRTLVDLKCYEFELSIKGHSKNEVENTLKNIILNK